MADEWLSTAEVAERLGYQRSHYLIQKLKRLGIPFRRLSPRSKHRWSWDHIQRVIVPRETNGE